MAPSKLYVCVEVLPPGPGDTVTVFTVGMEKPTGSTLAVGYSRDEAYVTVVVPPVRLVMVFRRPT
jgi:hypothetical protein